MPHRNLGETPFYAMSKFILGPLFRMMMKNLAVPLFMAFMITSCTGGVSLFPARYKEAKISPLITPIKIADYETDLDRKIEGSAQGYLTKATNLEYYKEQAVLNACNAAKVDLLVNPTFTLNTKGASVTVNVIGYPAKYTEIRNIVPADSIHLKYSGTLLPAQNNLKGRIKMVY